jgi:C-terminal processing protease CtpA/Prc
MMRVWILGWLMGFAGALAQGDDVAVPAAPGPAGIGAAMIERNGAAVINEVLPGSPAEKAGLQAQETIVWVDYRDVAGMTLEEIVNLIRGEPGTHVAITVISPGNHKSRTFDLTRAPIMPILQ